jgi:hypothetical protein
MYLIMYVFIYGCMYVCGGLFTLIPNAGGPLYPGYMDTRVGPEALEEGRIGCSCRLPNDSLAARPSVWLLRGLCQLSSLQPRLVCLKFTAVQHTSLLSHSTNNGMASSSLHNLRPQTFHMCFSQRFILIVLDIQLSQIK